MAVPNLYANTPAVGSIAWDAFNIRYGDQSYGIPALNTANKFVWWKYCGAPVSVVATNLVGNPSLEVDAAGYVNIGSGQWTLSRQPSGYIGGWCGRITATGTGSQGQGWQGSATMAAGTYSQGIYVRPSKTLTIQAYCEGSAAMSGTYTPVSCPAGVWTRVTGTVTVTTAGTMKPGFLVNSAMAVGDYVEFDANMLVAGATLPTYFDGDLPTNGLNVQSWSGTPHASNSVQTLYSPSLLAGDVISDGVIKTIIRNGAMETPNQIDPTLPDQWRRAQQWGVYGTDFTAVLSTADKSSGTQSLKMTTLAAAGANKGACISQPATLVPGATMRVTFRARATTALPAGTYVGLLDTNGAYQTWWGTQNFGLGTAWQTYSITGVVPTGLVNGQVAILAGYNQAANSVIYIDDVEFGPDPTPALNGDDLVLFGNKNGTPINLQSATLIDGGLVVSGSILTDALSANAVTAEKILAGSIDATKIAADTITANQIAANAITASELAANSVAADRLQANAVIAGKIATDAVTAGTVAAEAITTREIKAATITAGNIAADAITAPKILAGAVTAGKIDVGAVTADNIAAGAISADKIAAGQITADKFNSTLVMALKIILGDRITMSDTEGIQIRTDSGLISFPTDGKAATITADLVANSLQTMGTLNIRGTTGNFLAGTLNASSGIVDPKTGPTITNYWPSSARPFATYMDQTTMYGTAIAPGSKAGEYLSVTQLPGNVFRISRMNPGVADVVVKTFPANNPDWVAGGNPNYIAQPRENSLVRLSDGNYAMLLTYYLTTGGTIGQDPLTMIARYDANFNLLNLFGAPPTGVTGYQGTPVLFADGLNVGLAWKRNSDSKLCIQRYVASTGATSGALYVSTSTLSGKLRYLDGSATAAAWGGAAYVAYIDTVLSRLDANGAKLANDPTPPPKNGRTIAVMAPSNTAGESYVEWDNSFTIWSYSPYTSGLIYSAFSWYDSDPAGTYAAGGESLVSPTKSATRATGAFTRVDFPGPPDGGDPDDPDSVRVYASTETSGANLKAQGIATAGATSYIILGDPKVGAAGSAPVSPSAFAGRPGNIGRFRSNGIDTIGNPVWDYYGSGKGIAGFNSWDDTGKSIVPALAATNGTALNQAIPATTLTNVLFGTTQYVSGKVLPANTTDAVLYNADGSITIGVAGYYHFDVGVGFATGSFAGQRRAVEMRATRSGVTKLIGRGEAIGSTAGYPCVNFSTDDYFPAGSTVVIQAYVSAATTVGPVADWNRVNVRKIG